MLCISETILASRGVFNNSSLPFSLSLSLSLSPHPPQKEKEKKELSWRIIFHIFKIWLVLKKS